jgi:signal transduction histidine kinase
MKQLVQELIDLARGDAAEGGTSFEEVDLSSLISDDILSWEPVAYDAGRTLSDDIKEDILVKGNKDKLKQIADILIDNAIKYSDKGSEIAVKLRKKDKKAVLYVKNAGKALTEEEKTKIFDRFYRADESRESTAGYGLGLSIAIQLAELHKGKLYVETESDDKGTEFNIFKLELPM